GCRGESAGACACAGDRDGRWLRRLRQVGRRLPLQCRRACGGSLFVRELVCEEREPEAAPGELRLAEERRKALGDRRKADRIQGGKACMQGFSTLGRVEVGRE